MYPKIIAFGR